MSVTARELAKILNLSPSAVSIALNNKPGVSTATRKRVLEAAYNYGYDLERLHKKFSGSGPICSVIYKKHGAVVGETAFFQELFNGIEEECKKTKYKLSTRYVSEFEGQLEKQIEDIQYAGYAGIIVLGTEMNSDDIQRFQNLPIPVVLLDSYFEDTYCNCVVINNAQGAFMAASHLIKTTGRQPGYLQSSYQIGNFLERSTGFFNAVRANGMAIGGSPVHQLTPSLEGAYSDMLAIIESGEKLASSYFADNDFIALGAMRALKKCGYRIPEDVAVVGFDNIPISTIVEPPLSTINVPKTYMGETAVKRLVELIDNPRSVPVKIQINTQLIERKSTNR